jgi:L-amino acid N-acyltransferase YncA
MKVSLAYASHDDLPYIVEVYNTTIASGLVTADLNPVTVSDRESWFRVHDHASRPIWIVLAEGERVGWMSFSSFYGRPAYNGTAEFSIYIHPAHRKKGVGRQAIRMAIELAPASGLHTLLAFIFGHNAASLKLFGEAGFERWGLLPAVADMRGAMRDLAILGRKV